MATRKVSRPIPNYGKAKGTVPTSRIQPVGNAKVQGGPTGLRRGPALKGPLPKTLKAGKRPKGL